MSSIANELTRRPSVEPEKVPFDVRNGEATTSSASAIDSSAILTKSQRRALHNVSKKAWKDSKESAMRRWGPHPPSPNSLAARDNLRHSALTINFPCSLEGVDVIKGLQEAGVYRNQFETKISNGTLSVNCRKIWEKKLFGDAYDKARPEERPKYGAVNIFKKKAGGASRYGNCYFKLKDSVLPRVTVTPYDSAKLAVNGPVATCRNMWHLFEARECLREPNLNDNNNTSSDYVEFQIHGPVRLEQDIELVVAPDDLRETHQESLMRLAQRCNARLVWLSELTDTDLVYHSASEAKSDSDLEPESVSASEIELQLPKSKKAESGCCVIC